MFLKRIAELKHSLLARLTFLYAATFAVLAFAGFAAFYYRISFVTFERIDRELYEDTRVFARLIAGGGFAAARDKILQDAKIEDPGKEFYRVLNARAEVLASTDMSAWGDPDRHRPVARLKNQASGYLAQTVIQAQGDRARVITAAIGPSLLLQIGETLEDTDEYLAIFRQLLAILVVIFIIISAVFGWYMARRSLAGMDEVTRAAEDITSGRYERRVEVVGHFREVQRLGDAFNTMINRIQALLRSMEQINDNIAHELRGPLTRIRGIAEMILLKENDVEHYQDMAVSTIEECDMLIDMINTMLEISEIEAGVNLAKRDSFDLAQVLAGACELFRPIAVAKSIGMNLHIPESLLFQGDRKRMQRIVTNLLENAIKYTSEGGTVEVRARNRGHAICIDIADTGRGIAEGELANIFKRFYRCDQSRTEAGVGLGLSLVKAYTESMHGQVLVASVLNQGSVFTLRFSI